MTHVKITMAILGLIIVAGLAAVWLDLMPPKSELQIKTINEVRALIEKWKK
jgi:hypothetical protein